MKKTIHLVCAIAACMGMASAHAGEWRVGPGIAGVSGIGDVADLYESNFNNSQNIARVEVDVVLPVGLAVQITRTWDSGVRMDLGVGPFFLIHNDSSNSFGDDSEHTEVATNATVGYTFFPGASASPYLRAGVAYHYADGTYAESSDPGLMAAAGLEFRRTKTAMISLEVAMDKSEVKFERIQRNPTRRDYVSLNTFDTTVSLFVKF
jgi:Outer membrane protein beta-barrel domain